MRGSNWRIPVGAARRPRRRDRAFRPGDVANGLETRLLPAVTLTLSPATLPDDTLGQAYDQTVTASGGSGGYTYAVTTGALPGGLSLNSASGAITGTPGTAGASSFTVTATDSSSDTGSQAYTVTINPALAFSTTTLPGGAAGTAYSQQVATTGGTSPVTFAVTTGTLPAGLSLSTAGLLAGTPTTAGSTPFTVTATDAAGTTATENYTLDVAASSSTTGPTVSSVQRFGFHAQPTIFKVTFSTALDPTSAQDVSNYTLAPLVNGKAGTPITLSSAVYDATNDTVTLTPAHNVYLYARYQLTVNGTSPAGVQDTSGTFLAGAGGVSGTNYVKTFGDEVLSGPNVPSGTPTAIADFINNEWTDELAARFASLAAAAGDTPAATAAAPAVRTASRSAALATVPTASQTAATDAALDAAHPATIDTVLAAIVPTDADKKK